MQRQGASSTKVIISCMLYWWFTSKGFLFIWVLFSELSLNMVSISVLTLCGKRKMSVIRVSLVSKVSSKMVFDTGLMFLRLLYCA
mgnify:FL=1